MYSSDVKLPALKWFWWFAGTIILLKLWFVGGHEFLAKTRGYDDSLFLVHAQNMLNGNWLGELNYRTLIKGPGYPLFIAAAYWVGVPLLMAQQLLYVGACVVAIYALRGMVLSGSILCLCFLVLLFNPFTYYYPMVGALMRESVYNSFALMFLSAMLGLWLHHIRSLRIALAWSIVMGVAFAMLWLTREETIWTVPGMILFAILFVPGWSWNDGSKFLYRTMLLVIPIVIAVTGVYGITRINAAHYGAPVFIEVKSSEFISALGSLMNIREDKFKHKVIVGPRSQEAAFRVSPTFASLRPYIEDKGKKEKVNVFYVWTLRSAVNKAGHYSEPGNIQPALDVYKKIGEEISLACQRGEIRCFDRKPTMQPPLYPQHLTLFPREFLSILFDAVGFRKVNADSSEFNSTSDMGMLMTFDYVTGESAVRKSMHLEHMRPKFATEMASRKEGSMRWVGKFYQIAVPVLVIAALIFHFFTVVLFLRKKTRSTIPMYGLVLGGSILGILVMLTYVKVTLFTVARPITVVYPLILLYVVTMLSAAFEKRGGR